MKPAAPVRIIIAAVVSIAALSGLVIWENTARARGTEVLLPMEAVDPRNVLTGHYVIVQLRERIGADTPCPPGLASSDDTFASRMEREANGWVALSARGGHHTVSGAADRSEAARALGQLIVRGQAECWSLMDTEREGWIGLDLGVERFHINQAEAERVEALMRDPARQPPVFAIVSVGRDGRARLNGLMVDGERMELKLW